MRHTSFLPCVAVISGTLGCILSTVIVGHGYKILAEAIEKNLTYEIKCSHLIICGKEDRAGSCIRYLKVYEKDTNKQIHWIDHAGHNSNTDQPEIINELIDKFVDECDINQKKKCGIR